jgi:hypothetical protein
MDNKLTDIRCACPQGARNCDDPRVQSVEPRGDPYHAKRQRTYLAKSKQTRLPCRSSGAVHQGADLKWHGGRAYVRKTRAYADCQYQ